MAGSYSHLKRNADSYGGVSVSLIENMGDATEAMVGMYWMIEILSGGDRSKIKAAEARAICIESGQEQPPSREETGQ
jgi:hypothetical protein